MALDINAEIARLEALTTLELKAEFARLWGSVAYSKNRRHLIRRCAWRLQEMEYGGLSERALRRAEEIADESSLRQIPPRNAKWQKIGHGLQRKTRDPRLPKSGSTLVRRYRGKTITVEVLESTFEWKGEEYPSLSSLAKAITGSHVNGYQWFGLAKKPR